MIRRATVKDEAFIKDIYKRYRKELGSFDLYMCWQKFLRGESKELFYVMPGKGFVRYGFSKKYNSFVIHDIGVSEQGKGYGRKLLNSVPLPLMLKCNKDNVIGNAFYASIPMELVGETETRKGVKQNIWKKCVEL